MKPSAQIMNKLREFAAIFRNARDENANEANTVQYLIKFFEEVFGYSLLNGEISREYSIKNKYCDLAIKIDDEVKYIIEVKAAGNKHLTVRDIEQAESYASRDDQEWVLLTNGIEWKMFHLKFNGGIEHKELFSFNFADDLEEKAEEIWERLELLSKRSVKKDELDDYFSLQEAKSPVSLIKALSSENVLNRIKTELYRISNVRLKKEDVVDSLNKIISSDAHNEGGEVKLKRKYKPRSSVVNLQIQPNVVQNTGQGQQVNRPINPETSTNVQGGGPVKPLE